MSKERQPTGPNRPAKPPPPPPPPPGPNDTVASGGEDDMDWITGSTPVEKPPASKIRKPTAANETVASEPMNFSATSKIPLEPLVTGDGKSIPMQTPKPPVPPAGPTDTIAAPPGTDWLGLGDEINEIPKAAKPPAPASPSAPRAGDTIAAPPGTDWLGLGDEVDEKPKTAKPSAPTSPRAGDTIAAPLGTDWLGVSDDLPEVGPKAALPPKPVQAAKPAAPSKPAAAAPAPPANKPASPAPNIKSPPAAAKPPAPVAPAAAAKAPAKPSTSGAKPAASGSKPAAKPAAKADKPSASGNKSAIPTLHNPKPSDTIAAGPMVLTGSGRIVPVSEMPKDTIHAHDTIAAPPGRIPGGDTGSMKTMVADFAPASSKADTIAAPPGKIPGDTSSMKTMVSDFAPSGPKSDTIAAPPGKIPGDTSSLKTMVSDFSSAARTPSQAGADTGSLKTLVSDFSSAARTPSQAGGDISSLKTLINTDGHSGAATPSQVTGDTGSMKTLVGPLGGAPPSHPTGDIGNMQTLVSDVAGPPSAVRTGSHPSDLLRRQPTPGSGVKTGSNPSGLRIGSGTVAPGTGSGTGPSATPSGTRFPISGTGSSAVKIGGAGSSSSAVSTGMAGGKRWQPGPEDIAEVHGDNQLGNLQPVENGRVLGQYILMKKLGQGGMGAVYRGIKMGLNTDVAIKILFAHLAAAKGGSDHQARFLREAQLAASLDNPNLVRVIDVQQDFNSGILYLVMEFVEGYSVADLIKDKTEPLAEEEGLELIIGACKGLRAAHQQNIVHRDIKPDNIMIRNRDKVVKVADMGLAKAIGDQDEVSVSRTESVIGTPAYMAPEQARDSKHVDLRADIYSMGATLFHMTTLRLPFEDPQLFMLLKKVITEPVPDPRTYNEKLSENLSRIIKKCMAKQPDNRYQRIDELIDDLEIALRNTRGEKDAVVDDIKLVVPEMEPEAPRPWYLHPITWAAMFLVVLGGAVYGAWYFATGGLSPFEQSHNKAMDFIHGNLVDKAEHEIDTMKTLAKGPDDQKIVVATESALTDLKYQDDIADGKSLLDRDKQYATAEGKFLDAQKLHDTDEVKGLIEAARMGPYRDEIQRLIKPDVAKFDDARSKLADAAKALNKSESWLANHALNQVIALEEGRYRVNEQLALLGKPGADEAAVRTAMKVSGDWLAKTGSNPEISSMIDDLKKRAVKNVFQPRAETELRDEKFDDVPKSIDWIKQLSPGDKLIDTLTTRLNDARQARDNREKRDKADKLLADADKLLNSKSVETVAESQDLKLLDSAKSDYTEAQKFEDFPRDNKGEYIVDPKTGKHMPRRSEQGFNNVQDLISQYQRYQDSIKEGDDRLEFNRFDEAVDAYVRASKIIKTDQASQRITRANDRKSNHEAIQNIEATIATDPIKAASLLKDKLDKVPDDADLLRVKTKLIQVTRPEAFEIADLQERFRLVPAGTFTMGNDKGDADEKPAYKVKLRYPYYMSVTEVTVKQYETLVPTYKRPLDNAGRPVADEMPVSNISWEDAARFAQLLTDREKVKLKEHEIYRLPTEAEWEYAARGADGRPYPWGDTWQEGFCQGGSDKFDLAPTVVGSFPSGASPFGILDMTGNVSEFCIGGYSATRYAERAAQGLAVDPRSTDDTNLKVVRGGSAFTLRDKLRLTKRFSLGKKDSGMGVGIRLVRTVEPLAIDPP